jgi:hypothetical protein
MIKQYIFVLKNDTFFSQSVGRKQLFWFFEALDCVNVKTKCAVCAVGFKLAENGSALGVRAGFRRTKLSTYHKTPIEKLNLNLTTSPRMTPNVC